MYMRTVHINMFSAYNYVNESRFICVGLLMSHNDADSES